MIVLKMSGDLFSERMERLFDKLAEAQSHAGTPQFDELIAQAYALYEKLSDEERLWFDEQSEEIGRPTIN
ncbi:hypothetical protein [Bradyrhizobium sp. 174]|uniref:hypothetical protein n=1 Tax=Bradyrhizobium sp. 174 TaxID=2782645 RepID=UPI001FF99CD7|nr:hypothetical protein [Bradyrhizobium sp. 174]MCK1577762.1 hypothetical protein [Bradyrhizobium sp. 174]